MFLHFKIEAMLLFFLPNLLMIAFFTEHINRHFSCEYSAKQFVICRLTFFKQQLSRGATPCMLFKKGCFFKSRTIIHCTLSSEIHLLSFLYFTNFTHFLDKKSKKITLITLGIQINLDQNQRFVLPSYLAEKSLDFWCLILCYTKSSVRTTTKILACANWQDFVYPSARLSQMVRRRMGRCRAAADCWPTVRRRYFIHTSKVAAKKNHHESEKIKIKIG